MGRKIAVSLLSCLESRHVKEEKASFHAPILPQIEGEPFYPCVNSKILDKERNPATYEALVEYGIEVDMLP